MPGGGLSAHVDPRGGLSTAAVVKAIWTSRGAWLGLGAWLLALSATVSLSDETTSTRDGVLLAIAAGLAVLAWGAGAKRTMIGPTYSPAQTCRWDRNLWLRLVVGLIAAGVLILSADTWYLEHPGETFGVAGVLWLLGIGVLVGVAATWPHGSTSKNEGTASAEAAPFCRAEILAFIGLVVLATVLRVWALADFPRAIHSDEVMTKAVAMGAFGSGHSVSVFQTVWSLVDLPALWFAGVAASLHMFGNTLEGLRLPAAMFGAATVIPFYGLVRELSGRATAIAGTFILAVSASNLQYSRVGVNNITTSFFWAACFYFLVRGVRRHRALDWVLAGVVGGLSEYAFYGTRLLGFILLAYAAYLLIAYRNQLWQTLGNLALLLAGYVAGFGPLLAYYISHPDVYFARGRNELIWNHIPTSWHDVQLMWTTLRPPIVANLLAFSTTRDNGSFYWAALLLPAEAALLVLGAAMLIRCWQRPGAFLLLLSGFGTLLVGGTLVGPAPSLQLWTPAFPAIYAALALPIGAWLESLSRWQIRWPHRLGVLAVVVGLGVSGWCNIDFYFNHYYIGDPGFEVRSDQSHWEAALGPTYRVRTVGASWQSYSQEYTQMLITDQDGSGILNPAAELPLPYSAGKGIGFAFFGDEEQYIPEVRALYPGGRSGEVYSQGGDPLFSTYVVTPAQVEQLAGVTLDLVGTQRNVYHWQGSVDTFGDLPPHIHGPMAATWSSLLYLPRLAAYQISLAGPATRLLFDGRSVQAVNAILPPGWHRVVVEAMLPLHSALRLRLCQDSGPVTEVSRTMLWPVAPYTGVLGAVQGTMQPLVDRVDPFIGFTMADQWQDMTQPDIATPALLGPYWQAAMPLRIGWAGQLWIASTGAYGFALRTSGQARLLLDGKEALTGCSVSAAVQPTISRYLTRGWHSLQLAFVGMPSGSVIELYWQPPGGDLSVIPPTVLRYATPDGRQLQPAAPTTKELCASKAGDQPQS